jgi:hypothetical protein
MSLVLCFVLSAILTQTQTAATKQATPPKSVAVNSTRSTDAAAEELKERRARARSLLVALSTDARTFRDQTLRARSLARIADALWKVDPEQGRLMFRKAWEAAEVADQESDQKLQEEINQQKAQTGGGYAINLPPNVRREVLRLAAKHDRALGEEFLEKLKLQKVEAANSGKPNTNRLNDALIQRLDVARELMQVGEVDRALQFADPALTLVTVESMNFLCDVREKNAAAADMRYSALLASSANNPQADANTVSLLASYIFTPHLFMTFAKDSTSSSQSAQAIVPADVSSELRNAFFQSAAAILLRPLPVLGQPDPTTAGLDGKYLVIKRLLPFFELSAPPAMVESLRGHLNALQTMASDSARRYDEDQLNRGIRPERPSEDRDRDQTLLDKIDRAKTSAERDSLYLQLAFIVAGRGDMRARDYVSKVEDPEVRKQAQVYMDASLALYSVGKKQTDQALELVHKGELTQVVKAWVLTECAKILFKTDRDKALELVDEANTEARRIEVSDPSLPRALVAVANALNEIDRDRVWDATFDAVKAANSAEGFTGEDGEIVAKFQSKGHSSVHTSDAPQFDLDGLFRDLATHDYDRAVELARGFQGEGPRAVATIAIARAILEPNKPNKK